jgi:hypothetical protein
MPLVLLSATATPGATVGTTAAAYMGATTTTTPGGTGDCSGGLPPPPPPQAAQRIGLPKNYLEYYTPRRDLHPPLKGVMDMFKAYTRHADPSAAVRTYNELNAKILDTNKEMNPGTKNHLLVPMTRCPKQYSFQHLHCRVERY